MKAQKETAVPTTKLDLNKVNPKLHSLAKEDSKELLGTAKHEAGHAIIAKLCGGAVIAVTLYATNDKERSEKGFLGTASHSHIYDNFKGLMVNTSGLAGELIDEESPRPFFLPDTINDLYPGTIGDANLIDSNVFEKFIGPGSVQVHPDFDRIKWVNEAYYQSLQLLRQFRPVFDEVVAALLEKKQLTAEELNPILSKLPRKSPRSKLYTWSTTHKAVEALEATNPNDPRLAVYRATKRAMEINTATWKAQQAMDAAKKAHHEAEVNGKRAHQEIVYMLRNNKSLVEAKQHFLGILKDVLKVQRGQLRYQRQLPWGQRNYQITQALRNRINVMKEEISTCKTELKQVKATVAA